MTEMTRSQKRRKIEKFNKGKSFYYKALSKEELEEFAYAILDRTKVLNDDSYQQLSNIYQAMKNNR